MTLHILITDKFGCNLSTLIYMNEFKAKCSLQEINNLKKNCFYQKTNYRQQIIFNLKVKLTVLLSTSNHKESLTNEFVIKFMAG